LLQSVEAVDKQIDQDGDVFFAPPQGRKLYPYHIDAVVEIFAKIAFTGFVERSLLVATTMRTSAVSVRVAPSGS
jgi:hypothetical protein